MPSGVYIRKPGALIGKSGRKPMFGTEDVKRIRELKAKGKSSLWISAYLSSCVETIQRVVSGSRAYKEKS
jgi:hypothetical protein